MHLMLTEIILLQLHKFQTEIPCTLTSWSAFKVPEVAWRRKHGGHEQYAMRNELHLCCVFKVQFGFQAALGYTGFDQLVPVCRICNSVLMSS